MRLDETGRVIVGVGSIRRSPQWFVSVFRILIMGRQSLPNVVIWGGAADAMKLGLFLQGFLFHLAQTTGGMAPRTTVPRTVVALGAFFFVVFSFFFSIFRFFETGGARFLTPGFRPIHLPNVDFFFGKYLRLILVQYFQ